MVYSSYDLVGLLLSEHDRRTNASVLQAYADDMKRRSSLSVQLLNIMDSPA
jgi:hypothetical protein